MKNLPCALCDVSQRVPDGSDSEYELILGAERQAYLVCDECSSELLGVRGADRASTPRGVRDALSGRYKVAWVSWMGPNVLPDMLRESRRYLSSREARNGMDFGTWQKMNELGAFR